MEFTITKEQVLEAVRTGTDVTKKYFKEILPEVFETDVETASLKKLKIKAGERYICRKDVVMETGEIRFIRGKVYSSEYDRHLTNEVVNERHMLSGKFAYKYFLKLP